MRLVLSKALSLTNVAAGTGTGLCVLRQLMKLWSKTGLRNGTRGNLLATSLLSDVFLFLTTLSCSCFDFL